MLLASLEEPRTQVSSQGPCLVRGPPCGQKAGLFLEEEGHHAIRAPQTVHLPPGAVYVLLGADDGVPVSLCDTRRLRLGEVLGPRRSKGQSKGGSWSPPGNPETLCCHETWSQQNKPKRLFSQE